MRWYTVHRVRSKPVQKELSADEKHVTYNMSAESNFTLTIKDLRESDANDYCCRETTDDPELCWNNKTELQVSDLQVKVLPATEGQTVTLMCSTSCPLTENPAVYIWYKNRKFLYQDWSPWYQQLVSSEEAVTYSCAIKGYEDLRAPQVSVDSVTSTCFSVTYAKGRMCSYKTTSEEEPCSITYPRGPEDENCLIMNYVSRRICALRGSSVNISSEYSSPNNQPKSKLWYKIKRSGQEEVKETIKNVTRMKYHDNFRNHHILRINNLTKNDSAEYTFRYHSDDQGLRPGVSLVVTGLRVKFTPSAVVTEGQRLTLSCSTSCPLTDNTNYIWYLNSRPLTPTEKQNKHLVLDPVSRQHAGNYSCAVKTPHHISSDEKTLTVQSKMGKWTPAAAAVVVVCAALLVIIPLAAFWWIR
ncbi:hypothetical protein EPR50_G00012290 [Perca flavescens]|uniref:Ig-like domain-containing protein n=1 Tax=Perca flavescens TaxID=8167 RepID=A0A484DJN7_PERFV|nr:hypothetical protein EPR50_G00012290 [Perca flavescens]